MRVIRMKDNVVQGVVMSGVSEPVARSMAALLNLLRRKHPFVFVVVEEQK